MSNAVVVEEPLMESVPLAMAFAQESCEDRPENWGRVSCRPYHAAWQLMRLLGSISTLNGQAAFVVDHLRAAAQDGAAPRVLVSGAADYSMPAHVIRAYEQASTKLDLTVLDLCRTPLRLTEWYCERAGATVTTERRGILDYKAEQPFDVIVTSSFLHGFSSAERPMLYRAWHSQLRPGGAVIFTNPIFDIEQLSDSDLMARAERLRQRAIDEMARFNGSLLDLSTEEVAALFYEFGLVRPGFYLQSADEVRAQMTAAGFDLEVADEHIDTRRDSRFGSSQHRDLRVVARRL